MPRPTLPPKQRRFLSTSWRVATIDEDYIDLLAQIDGTWARKKIKSFLYSEVQSSAIACINADLASFISTHTAPAADANPCAVRFSRMVLKCVALAVESGQSPPPAEWLQGWMLHTYAPGGASFVRPFLRCDLYPEAIRLEWLKNSMSAKFKDFFSFDKPDTAAILAVPAFNATILLFNLINHIRKKSTLFGLHYTLRDMYGSPFTETTCSGAIGRYAPILAPHWGTIELLGLSFPEAHALVFGSSDKIVDLPSDFVFSS